MVYIYRNKIELNLIELRHLDLSGCPLLHKSLQPPCIMDFKGSDTT